MTARACYACEKQGDNCDVPGEDGLPVQCVGAWSKDKHAYLDKYLGASCAARRMYFKRGNAVFIDLFSGPGKCIIRDTEDEVDGGCLKAVNRKDCPFNEYHFVDIREQNIESLKKRVGVREGRHFYVGDANEKVSIIMDVLLKYPYRYHVFYIDPFGPRAISFATIESISRLKHADLLIHFPIGAIKRNLLQWTKKREEGIDTILDRFLGTHVWRERIEDILVRGHTRVLLDIFKEQLRLIGFPEEGLGYQDHDHDVSMQTISVRTDKNLELYLLMMASKKKLAIKLWDSVLRIDAKGQKGLF